MAPRNGGANDLVVQVSLNFHCNVFRVPLLIPMSTVF